MKLLRFYDRTGDAAILGGAAKVVAALLCLVACGGAPAPRTLPSPRIYESGASRDGRCAWYATRSGDLLLFGISAFWSAGEPTLGLARHEAVEIGHFDLADERFLPARPLLEEAAPSARSGVWDLVVTAQSGLFFTSLGGRPGVIDARKKTRFFEELGSGSNEAIALPNGGVAYSDYDSARLTLLEADFGVERHIDLRAKDPVIVAPKSLAYDPKRRRFWVTTDLLDHSGGATAHDTRVHDYESGREIERIVEPEIQMLAFSPSGSGYYVFAEGRSLWLERHGPAHDANFGDGKRILLDRNFARDVDFAQELRIEADGRVVITRWSGAIHVLERDDTLRTIRLPRPPPVGLFYSAALRGDRVCATYCSGVRVICGDLP